MKNPKKLSTMKHKRAASLSLVFLVGIIFTVFLVGTTTSIANQLLDRNRDERRLVEHWANTIDDLEEGRFTELPFPSGLDSNVVFGIFPKASESKPETRECRNGCVCAYDIERGRIIYCDRAKVQELKTMTIRETIGGIPTSGASFLPDYETHKYLWLTRGNNQLQFSVIYNDEEKVVQQAINFFVKRHQDHIELFCNEIEQGCVRGRAPGYTIEGTTIEYPEGTRFITAPDGREIAIPPGYN